MEKKNANLDEDNKFCSKEENKDNNKKEVKNQIYNISDKFKEFLYLYLKMKKRN